MTNPNRRHLVALVVCDFNAEPDSNTYDTCASRGWIDSHLAADNDECAAGTGENCTSGRSEVGGDLEDPSLNVGSRIDYVFVVPPGEGSKCRGDLLHFENPHVNLTNTGIFAGDPNPFAPTCGPAPDAICWTSDHSGNQVNLSCKGKH